MPSALTEYTPEWETFGGEMPPWSGEGGYELSEESTELELAAELLAVTNEQELDRFLGDLIGKFAGGAVGAIARSPLGRAIGKNLKGVIKSALPIAGGAFGTMVGGPLGASIGSGLATMAGRAFGLELEGLSHEDQEFEAAKRFVRFASDAVRNAASASPLDDPGAAAQAAIAAAARQSAPGLLHPASQASANGLPHQRSQRGSPPSPNIHIRSAEEPMHDIGRIQLESGLEMENYEAGQMEWSGEAGGVFNEAEEMEFASQLMEVGNEQELDHFLGDLIKQAGRAIGGFVNSPTGHAIGGLLKGAAKQLLPQAAAAVGGAFGGPLGAQIGSGLASMAVGGELGMEAEGFGQEGREYEGAREFVRLAGDTVRDTLAAGPNADPMAAAQAAIAQAMQMRAPGFFDHHQGLGRHHRHSGRWQRRGNRIVLYGV